MAMKLVSVVLALALLCTASAGSMKIKSHVQVDTDKRAISEVITMLENMLAKSQEEGQTEATQMDEYKSYCDTNDAEKTQSIEDATTEIQTLGNSIDELKGSTGSLSEEVAALKKEMDLNEQARAEATSVREKEAQAFSEEEADLNSAIGQLTQAIDILAAVGADQTMQAAASHDKFMAGYEESAPATMMLNTVKTSVKKALVAAGSLLNTQQRNKMTAFLQKDFPGTYDAQSGQVVGILKNMQSTFESNLASAKEAEEKAITAYDAFIETKTEAFNTMSESYNAKSTSMGTNDSDLSTKVEQLQTAEQTKADDEEFLSSLREMCTTKMKEWEERKKFRAAEEASISEAIAILQSDRATRVFPKIEATGAAAASFLQQSSVHKTASARMLAENFLMRQAHRRHSHKLSRVAVLLRAGNPFTVVLEEIDKMVKLIDEEGTVDQQQLDWCNSERTNNDAVITSKTTEIEGQDSTIESLDTAINDPDSGLKAQITENEESLAQNLQDQTDQTGMRRNESKAYRAQINDIVSGEGLIQKAIDLLKKHYAHAAMIRKSVYTITREDPTPPEAFTGPYEGQKTEGQNVITLLEEILTNTKAEESSAHQAEQEAQSAYEDSMKGLTDAEENLKTSIADLKADLAQKEQELEATHEDRFNTEKERMAREHYLKTIKPGCDFITENYDIRESNRAMEKSALENAIELLKGSPAYATAVANAKVAGFGECKDTCVANEAHAECQACLAKVSVPGYCAGHPETPGCSSSAAAAA